MGLTLASTFALPGREVLFIRAPLLLRAMDPHNVWGNLCFVMGRAEAAVTLEVSEVRK